MAATAGVQVEWGSQGNQEWQLRHLLDLGKGIIGAIVGNVEETNLWEAIVGEKEEKSGAQICDGITLRSGTQCRGSSSSSGSLDRIFVAFSLLGLATKTLVPALS